MQTENDVSESRVSVSIISITLKWSKTHLSVLSFSFSTASAEQENIFCSLYWLGVAVLPHPLSLQQWQMTDKLDRIAWAVGGSHDHQEVECKQEHSSVN